MPKEPEVTREGLFEKFVGKTKEVAGELVGNEDLAEAGRDEQAHADADPAAREDAESDQP